MFPCNAWGNQDQNIHPISWPIEVFFQPIRYFVFSAFCGLTHHGPFDLKMFFSASMVQNSAHRNPKYLIPSIPFVQPFFGLIHQVHVYLHFNIFRHQRQISSNWALALSFMWFKHMSIFLKKPMCFRESIRENNCVRLDIINWIRFLTKKRR